MNLLSENKDFKSIVNVLKVLIELGTAIVTSTTIGNGQNQTDTTLFCYCFEPEESAASLFKFLICF